MAPASADAGYGSTGNVVKSSMKTYSGGKDPFAMKSPFSRNQVFLEGKRSRLNYLGIVVSLFVPWAVFCIASALLAFELHFSWPWLCHALLVVLFLLGVVAPGIRALMQIRKKVTDPQYVPEWFLFLTVACFIAFVLGAFHGAWIYFKYMHPYYNLENLAEYRDIDTNQFVGAQLMDAGRIDFRQGTQLDLGHSMGFKNNDLFCVAPIVTPQGRYAERTYDFWAVGKNCCSGSQADFHCKGFADPRSTGALRLVDYVDRPFYRLAVQQAEATYKIRADHPLFFMWVHNAEEETYNFKKHGIRAFILGVLCDFVLQGFLTSVATLAFSKMVHA